MIGVLRRGGFWFGVALVVWVSLTLARLDFRSVYHDEAFHILLGRLLLGGQDCPGCAFATGSVWIHPIAAAIGDAVAGLRGARAVNVLFALGLAAVAARAAWRLFDGRLYLVTATIVLFSGQTLYLSKLASYDMIAAFFLGASFLSLLEAEAERPARGAGRAGRHRMWLLLAAALLFAACITKYLVPVFVPFLFVWVWRRHGLGTGVVWFLLPLTALLATFAWTLAPTSEALFGTMRASREATQVPRAQLVDWTFRWVALPYLLAICGCFHARWGRTAIGLIALSTPILLLHFVTGAEQSVNKNVLLTLVFLAPAVALGVAQLAHLFSMGIPGAVTRTFYGGAVLFVFGAYGIYHMGWLERQYPDMTPIVEYLEGHGFDGMRVGINSTYGDAVYVYSLEKRFPRAEWFYLARGGRDDDERGRGGPWDGAEGADGDAVSVLDLDRISGADYLVFDGYYGKRHPWAESAERLQQDFEVLRTFTIDLAWGTTEARVLGRRK